MTRLGRLIYLRLCNLLHELFLLCKVVQAIFDLSSSIMNSKFSFLKENLPGMG